MKQQPVPDKLMIPAVRETMRYDFPDYCADSWEDKESLCCKQKLPSEYWNVSLKWIRQRAKNLRKMGKIGPIHHPEMARTVQRRG